VHNIISDQVKLQLTLRSYSPEVREKTIASIRNKSKHLALQAGLPEDRLPVISILEPQIPATLNDPELTRKLTEVLIRNFGQDNVVETPPSMVGEDFSRFALQPGKKVPICMFWIGAADPAKVKEAKANGTALPSLHSPMFAPLPEPTIKTGIKALATSSLYLFQTRP
jgi:hippurate hydrolase